MSAPDDLVKSKARTRQNAELVPLGIRICAVCDVPQEIKTEFKWNTYRCNTCQRKQSAASSRKWKTGWSQEDYDEAYAIQEGKCAICNTWQATLSADHCHKGLKKRGLLCNNCNVMIGMAHEDPEVLMAAVAYLMQHSEEE